MFDYISIQPSRARRPGLSRFCSNTHKMSRVDLLEVDSTHRNLSETSGSSFDRGKRPEGGKSRN